MAEILLQQKELDKNIVFVMAKGKECAVPIKIKDCSKFLNDIINEYANSPIHVPFFRKKHLR